MFHLWREGRVGIKNQHFSSCSSPIMPPVFTDYISIVSTNASEALNILAVVFRFRTKHTVPKVTLSACTSLAKRPYAT